MDGSPRFAYQFDVPTVVSSPNSTTGGVYYLEFGRPYPLTVKRLDETLQKSALYLQVELDFADESCRTSRDTLLSAWARHHPGVHPFELSTDSSSSRILMEESSQQPNLKARLIPGGPIGPEGVSFNIVINMLESQFWHEADSGLKPVGFLLVVNVFDQETATLFDTSLSVIRTFWPGRAQPNYDTDRFRLIEANPIIACLAKYELLQSIRHPRTSSLHTIKMETTEDDEIEIIEMPGAQQTQQLPLALSLSRVPVPVIANTTGDARLFVCLLQAPINTTTNSTYLDKDSVYGLVIKPIAFDGTQCSGPIQTTISIDFGQVVSQATLSTALTNWSLISQKTTLFDLDSSRSILDESVLDLYQEDSRSLKLIWKPITGREAILGLRFNEESSKLSRFAGVSELELKLTVESSELKIVKKEDGGESMDGGGLERSECVIRVFPTGTSKPHLLLDTGDSSADENWTFLHNSKPKKVVVAHNGAQNKPTSTMSTVSSVSRSSGTRQEDEKFALKIQELLLDGAQLPTLQERLLLDRLTVRELERRIRELIGRKAPSDVRAPSSVTLFFSEMMDLTDELLSIMLVPEANYQLSILTNDPDNGSYLAYLNLAGTF